MLVPTSDVPALIVCATCRAPNGTAGGGAALLAALRKTPGDILVEDVACLWSCGMGASVQLRGPGRIGYIMGGLAVADVPDLLAFAAAYAATADGEVAFADWPEGVLGHFIARTPPAGMAIVR